ncbi:hypothetical protein KSF_032400 [Reticulibacter mediterranei]|uniref:Uncharacterized protein n=1 Tax=Reticulibacter mediterranei TaxID=2778369 RepID=A0A8J3IL05_9CHLR|nr:hypothetical protein KSF_032400 [Reticulibacter mediterranei]
MICGNVMEKTSNSSHYTKYSIVRGAMICPFGLKRRAHSVANEATQQGELWCTLVGCCNHCLVEG